MEKRFDDVPDSVVELFDFFNKKALAPTFSKNGSGSRYNHTVPTAPAPTPAL